MNKSLFLSLILILTSSAIDAATNEAKQPDLMAIVTSYQAKLSSEAPNSALKLMAPKLREDFSGNNIMILIAMFSGLELDVSSFEQSCEREICTLTGKGLRNQRHVKVVYTFMKQEEDYYIANINSAITI